ncbi:MAG: metallophosphoesterase [Lachnospiraceae bacterium]|nr:metallophosphoesterase [Lachnospiraceae bacterium]
MVWILLLFILITIVLLWIVHDISHFQKVFYTFESPKLHRDLKMIFLSDLHNNKYGPDNAQLIHAIEEENPDLILVGGDMLNAKKSGSDDYGQKMDHAVQLLRYLSEHYTVYHALGNHEDRARNHPEKYGKLYVEYVSRLPKVHFLDNDSVLLDEYGIRLSGLSLRKKWYLHFQKEQPSVSELEQCCGKVEEERFEILLAHHPDYFSAYEKYGADLILAGHVHGGIVRLPLLGGVISPSLRLFPKYDSGLFTGKDPSVHMIISRGLGVHSIKVRLFNPGELTICNLKQIR